MNNEQMMKSLTTLANYFKEGIKEGNDNLTDDNYSDVMETLECYEECLKALNRIEEVICWEDDFKTWK